jgi:hypothetical protein
MTVVIPKYIADAIESCWEYNLSADPNAIKYIVLNDWTKIAECCAEEAAILKPYAQANPVKYMQALVEGYTLEFDENMSFNINGVELGFSADIIDDNYKTNTPLIISIGTAFEVLTIEEAKNISDNINVLIQELNKVRSEI